MRVAPYTMREDRQSLMLTHLSQLLDLITGFGGFIVPLVVWLTKKDEIYGMDEHGKSIINFQLSMFLYALICIPSDTAGGIGHYRIDRNRRVVLCVSHCQCRSSQ